MILPLSKNILYFFSFFKILTLGQNPPFYLSFSGQAWGDIYHLWGFKLFICPDTDT